MGATDSRAQTEEYEVDGKIFGMAVAEVFEEEDDGPPLVRYTAWPFGGSVPGPVLQVREGDRAVFTMKNRADEAVDVTKPGRQPTASASAFGLPTSGSSNSSATASPFMKQHTERDYQNVEPTVAPMLHSMDFHAGTVVEDDKGRTIGPGESIQFEWVAHYPGPYILPLQPEGAGKYAYPCTFLGHYSGGMTGTIIVK